MTTLATLQSLIAQGESETLEFKRSTAELRRVGETLSAFLNGDGGQVLLGGHPKPANDVHLMSKGGVPDPLGGGQTYPPIAVASSGVIHPITLLNSGRPN